MVTCYLIRKNGEYGSCGKEEFERQINIYGAKFIGTFNQLSQDEVQERYKRIIALASKTGYYAQFEIKYFIWAYLRFRNLRDIELANHFRDQFMPKIKRRHELKRLGLI